MPSHWGADRALKIARVFHFCSSVFLWTAYFLGDFHWLYLIGVILFNSMLVYQQSIVKPTDLSKVNLAFMTANGIASIVFSIFVIAAIILTF
jgi:4-hydroxybenzoate polyprenyltransferase